MLILHAALIGTDLRLWGEAPALPAPARRRQQGVAPLPFDSGPSALLAGVDTLVPRGASDRTGALENAILWSPTIHGVPVPSSPLIAAPAIGVRPAWARTASERPGEARARPAPRARRSDPSRSGVAPFAVTTLALLWPDLAALLRPAAEGGALSPGIVAGPDLVFWATALRFAAALVTGGRVLPDLVADDPVVAAPAPRAVNRSGSTPTHATPAASRDGATSPPVAGGERPETPSGRRRGARAAVQAVYRARWRPIVAGEDAQRVAALAATMPDACWALTRELVPPTTSGAASVLMRFIVMAVDRLVRAAAPGATGTRAGGPPTRRERPRSVPVSPVTPADARSLHDRWLDALRGAEDAVTGDPAALAAFAADISAWHRPVLALDAAPFRLCFRLLEPVEPDDDEAPASAEATAGTPSTARDGVDDRWSVEYLVQAADDPSLLVPAAEIWTRSSRAHRLLERRGGEPRPFLLQALGQASLLSRDVEASLRRPDPGNFLLDTAGAHAFLTDRAWVLEQAGFAVLVPAWWTRRGPRTRLSARARVKTPSMSSLSGLSLDDVLAVRWEVAVGDTTLSRAELQALAAAKAPLVRVRGQWVQVTADDRAHALALATRRDGEPLRAADLVRLALGASSRGPVGLEFGGVDAEGWFDDLLGRLQGRVPLEPIDTPPAFRGTLRPYQARGYAWLAFLREWGFGACLADDMGLGKTVQTLALVQREWDRGRRRPVLLICPTSVVGNWQREAARFTPDLPVLVHHGQTRHRQHDFAREAPAHALVVSSYALLARDLETLRAVEWSGIVLDEAQNVKNPDTRQARAARALPAPSRIALTGTPVENHVGDLWSIMEFLNPGLLGTQADFKRRFFVPIQAERDRAAAERLKRLTGPFVLRRLKTDPAIAADLPSKLEMTVYCTLTREQASLYRAVVSETERALRQSEGIQRKGIVLATLARLKQVCNHPAQFLADGSELPGRSGKLARLTEMLEEALPVGDRALVFSQFAEMGALLTRHLQETFGREVLFLHGGTAKADRDEMVTRFQSGDGPPVFVLSLKAGGTGLNLTAANHVFLFDRWWNPAVENQAIDRAFRIGQQRNVQVHKFLCAGTLEERIDEMIERKKAIAADVVGTGEGWLTELSTDELREVLTLREDAL
jgi:SNF2 family DNA or RNA helicase